jgi:hypothetical protein
MAQVWADLHDNAHQARARREENRRKVRLEDRRLARGEERPPRFQSQRH